MATDYDAWLVAPLNAMDEAEADMEYAIHRYRDSQEEINDAEEWVYDNKPEWVDTVEQEGATPEILEAFRSEPFYAEYAQDYMDRLIERDRW